MLTATTYVLLYVELFLTKIFKLQDKGIFAFGEGTKVVFKVVRLRNSLPWRQIAIAINSLFAMEAKSFSTVQFFDLIDPKILHASAFE